MKLHAAITDDLAAWAQRQPVFFTGSAPTHGAHINVSPKGLAASHFAVLSPTQCAYIDRTGSGCETIAHAYDNGRLCLMFMSLGPAPRILRFFARARVVEWDAPAFPDLVRRIAKGQRAAFDGARAVIVCDVFEVQTSCGFGVPRVKREAYAPLPGEAKDELSVFEERPTLDISARKLVDKNGVQAYHNEANLRSMDGLPGLRTARRSVGETLWLTDAKIALQRILAQYEAMAAGFGLAVLLYVILRLGLGLL